MKHLMAGKKKVMLMLTSQIPWSGPGSYPLHVSKTVCTFAAQTKGHGKYKNECNTANDYSHF